MKTRTELETEARRIEAMARESLGVSDARASIVTATGPLHVFPETAVKVNAASEFEGPLTHRILRHIAAAEKAGRIEFSLVEEEFVSSAAGLPFRHYDPIELVTSNEALDVLSAGYQRIDEDRLSERIEPIVDRIEASTFQESASADDVAEIETVAAELTLSAAARMRLKMDAVDLLEGRLEPGDFVARTVARQECFQRGERVTLSRQHIESIAI